jgi:hypothetical protein
MHESSVKIAFQYIANDASNVYLDNFKLEENNGSITKISSIEKDKLIIYPIPSNNRIFINYNNQSESILNIKIFNLNGRTVYFSKFYNKSEGNQVSIDISTLSTGMYFIEIDTDNGSIIKKIVKN